MLSARRNHRILIRKNVACAKASWPTGCSKQLFAALHELTTRFALSVQLGEITLLDGKWYVTHSGLLRLASRKG